MEKQRENSYARTAKQVEKMRRLYSQIGQPLPVDVIIDLYRHLPGAHEIHEKTRPGLRGKKQRVQA